MELEVTVFIFMHWVSVFPVKTDDLLIGKFPFLDLFQELIASIVRLSSVVSENIFLFFITYLYFIIRQLFKVVVVFLAI
jgi:hypothetical protein